MNHQHPRTLSRRTFLAASSASLIGAALTTSSLHAAAPAPKRPGMKKALKFSMIAGNLSVLEKFQLAKDVGFDGIEMDSPSNVNKDEVLKARDATGIVIPGVVDSVHWGKPFSHPDSAVRAEGLAGLQTALRECKLYGGTTVLLVPAVVNKQVSYDDAYTRSQAEIRKALPLAEELGVKIALENVWNQFLLSPVEAARYVDELQSPFVGVHFDIGNIVNFGFPEQWIRILNKRILKLDVKEFSRAKRDKEGLWAGFSAELLEGDNDWPAVMKALDDIGYRGWATLEVGGGG
ncbi:MAG TPA: sugar phosphate isomerase/epimerase family protein, partial [Tepidisphaeraceae bacterium]|nr:sugar phosphate isomerase/epimerase family protein [Tepidisphaeraceae bacterium]